MYFSCRFDRVEKRRLRRANVERFIVIVNDECEVVAREDMSGSPAFRRFTGDRLPLDLVHFVKNLRHADASVVLSDDGCLLHVIPVHASEPSLKALVFEELRVRARLFDRRRAGRFCRLS